MRFHFLKCLAMSLVIVICGCQIVPVRPLVLNASYEELVQRDIAVQPVQDYAARLLAQRGDTSPFDVQDGLSLHEAEAIALWYNPDLRIARLEADRAGASAGVAGRWADPELGLDAGRKWFDDDIDPSWIGLASLSITIPISGRTGAEKRAFAKEHESALLGVIEAEWRTLVALREAWIRWSTVVEEIRLLDEHVALVGTFAETARELALGGELDNGTARLFSIERGRKQALRDEAIYDEARLRAKVMGILGLLPDAPIEFVPVIRQADADISQSRNAKDSAMTHPAVVRLKADYDAAEARLRYELRKQYPDITLSPSFSEERDETSLILGFGFPVPVWNANRQGIAEAVAQREIARARAENGLQQVLSEIAQADSGLKGARARRERLMGEVAPEVDRQIEESQALHHSGELDMASLFQALVQAYDVKQDVLTAIAEEQSSSALILALTTPFIFQEAEKGLPE